MPKDLLIADRRGVEHHVELHPCRTCGQTDWTLLREREAVRCNRCGRVRSLPWHVLDLIR